MTGRRSKEGEELAPLPVDHGSATGRKMTAAGPPAADRAGLDRSGRALGLGVLLAGLVFVGALTGLDQGERCREASFVPPAPPAEPATVEGRPVTFADCSPQGVRLGDIVFAEQCGQGAIIRPSTGTWERIPHPQSLAETPVWTGEDALFWGGRFEGSADGVWLYRP